jgi:hypothetical protein
LAEEAKAGVTLGPRATVIVSNDAINRLRLAEACCWSNMLSSPFFELPGAGPHRPPRGEKIEEQ